MYSSELLHRLALHTQKLSSSFFSIVLIGEVFSPSLSSFVLPSFLHCTSLSHFQVGRNRDLKVWRGSRESFNSTFIVHLAFQSLGTGIWPKTSHLHNGSCTLDRASEELYLWHISLHSVVRSHSLVLIVHGGSQYISLSTLGQMHDTCILKLWQVIIAHQVPWAKANLNYAGQAFIISSCNLLWCLFHGCLYLFLVFCHFSCSFVLVNQIAIDLLISSSLPSSFFQLLLRWLRWVQAFS